MATEDEIRPEIYYIPDNFEDAGGVLGGHFSTRNAIELCVLCGPIAIIEYKLFFGGFLHIGAQTAIIIMMVSLIPLGALAAFGIGGESLSQILMAYIRFTRKRRKLSYIEFSDLKKAAVESITFDMILDAFSADGFKGVKKWLMQRTKIQKTKPWKLMRMTSSTRTKFFLIAKSSRNRP